MANTMIMVGQQTRDIICSAKHNAKMLVHWRSKDCSLKKPLSLQEMRWTYYPTQALDFPVLPIREFERERERLRKRAKRVDENKKAFRKALMESFIKYKVPECIKKYVREKYHGTW